MSQLLSYSKVALSLSLRARVHSRPTRWGVACRSTKTSVSLSIRLCRLHRRGSRMRSGRCSSSRSSPTASCRGIGHIGQPIRHSQSEKHRGIGTERDARIALLHLIQGHTANGGSLAPGSQRECAAAAGHRGCRAPVSAERVSPVWALLRRIDLFVLRPLTYTVQELVYSIMDVNSNRRDRANFRLVFRRDQ